MQFHQIQNTTIKLNNLFNLEHSMQIFKQILQYDLSTRKLIINNCGLKILSELFQAISDSHLQQLDLTYDWDSIMTDPKLVSWDKLSWKKLQHLNNWNKIWGELLLPLKSLKNLDLWIRCSWMNQTMLKLILQSIGSLPNLENARITISCKQSNLQNLLKIYTQKNIIKNLTYSFLEFKS